MMNRIRDWLYAFLMTFEYYVWLEEQTERRGRARAERMAVSDRNKAK